MGILDEAIKEHLELKRQHGAGESELKQIEDEAFGAAERPGSEAPADTLAEAPTEFMEQPEAVEGEEAPEIEEAGGRPQPRAEIADLQEPPEVEPEQPAAEPEAAEEGTDEEEAEEAPAIEHEAIAATEPEPAPTAAEPEPAPSPSTEERHAIADQPTEMYDVEEELAGSGEATEVELEEDEEDDFWDEKRLSDELDQALEAPLPEEREEPRAEQPPPARDQKDEDVLEETPDFLEEAPEDDQLWFEQKPPKDFDFDD